MSTERRATAVPPLGARRVGLVVAWAAIVYGAWIAGYLG
jgi:hypothetical protein